MSPERMTKSEMNQIYSAMSESRIMRYRWTAHVDHDDICWWGAADDSTFRTFIVLLENKWL